MSGFATISNPGGTANPSLDMNPIDPLNNLAKLLRKRIAAEASGKRGTLSLSRSKEAKKNASPHKASPEALREQVILSIKTIDPDDPKRATKTMKIFVESVLAWQFGANALSDPRFSDLVSNVQTAMETDPGVSEMLRQILHK